MAIMEIDRGKGPLAFTHYQIIANGSNCWPNPGEEEPRFLTVDNARTANGSDCYIIRVAMTYPDNVTAALMMDPKELGKLASLITDMLSKNT